METALIALISALAGGIPGTIIAWRGWLEAKTVALTAKTVADAQIAAAAEAKVVAERAAAHAAELLVKAEEIHIMVNSNLQRALADLVQATETITELRTLIVKLTTRE